EGGRAEQISRGRIRCVEVRPRVDDERAAGVGELERKLVVVPVAPTAVPADVAAAHDGVEAAVAQDEEAAFGVRRAPGGLLRRTTRLREQVAMVAGIGAVVPERQEASVVGVPDLRRETVRPRVV